MSRPLPLAAWTCPKCFVGQALYCNVVAPGPDNGLYVQCPGCEAIAIHHVHPSAVKALQAWAERVVAADVELVCREVAREADV